MALAARQRTRLAHNATGDNVPDDGHAVDKQDALLSWHVAEVDDMGGWPQRIREQPQMWQPAHRRPGSVQKER